MKPGWHLTAAVATRHKRSEFEVEIIFSTKISPNTRQQIHRYIKIMESWNHRMLWVGRDLKDHVVPKPCHGLPISSTKSGCSKFHPTRPWTLSGVGRPQLLFQCFSNLTEKNFFWLSNLTYSQFETNPFCPITTFFCKVSVFLFLFEGTGRLQLVPLNRLASPC